MNHSDPIQRAGDEPIAALHSEPIHLRPTATPAARALLPGDPGRALALAQFLLKDPLMFNHHRGLWGYTGAAADGEPLTIQSTGMGGPSAAIVLHELISLGVRRAIRVGTCGALDEALALGDLVVAREAIAADGTSAAIGAGELTRADASLTDALIGELERSIRPGEEPPAAAAGGRAASARAHRQGRIVSTDLFYERDSERNTGWSARGALAVEMEASALFAVGASAGAQVACVLAVSDTFGAHGARDRIDDDDLLRAAEAMGTAAAAALAA
jgi:DeoD family purine-nucleoside phosphorylase